MPPVSPQQKLEISVAVIERDIAELKNKIAEFREERQDETAALNIKLEKLEKKIDAVNAYFLRLILTLAFGIVGTLGAAVLNWIIQGGLSGVGH